MLLSDWKGWNQDPTFPRPHLRVGSGGEGICCWRSLPTWGLPVVSGSFPLFLCLWLLRLGSFWFAVAKDFAILLLSQYFPSHYSITYSLRSEMYLRESMLRYAVWQKKKKKNHAVAYQMLNVSLVFFRAMMHTVWIFSEWFTYWLCLHALKSTDKR